MKKRKRHRYTKATANTHIRKKDHDIFAFVKNPHTHFCLLYHEVHKFVRSWNRASVVLLVKNFRCWQFSQDVLFFSYRSHHQHQQRFLSFYTLKWFVLIILHNFRSRFHIAFSLLLFRSNLICHLFWMQLVRNDHIGHVMAARGSVCTIHTIQSAAKSANSTKTNKKPRFRIKISAVLFSLSLRFMTFMTVTAALFFNDKRFHISISAGLLSLTIQRIFFTSTIASLDVGIRASDTERDFYGAGIAAWTRNGNKIE